MTTAFIDVRNARAYVSRKRGTAVRWTLEPAANWRQLEPLALAEIERQGGSITLSGIYPCSDELAALALWAEDILALVTTPQEAEAQFELGSGTVRKAAARGEIPCRRAKGAWLIFAPSVEEKWGRA